MDDVIDKPKEQFNFKEFLNGLEKMGDAMGPCDDPSCPVCHSDTAAKDEPKDAGKNEFMDAVLAMPDKDQKHSAQVLKWMANNLESLGMLLLLKQMGNTPVFTDDRAIEAVLTSLTLSSAIVSKFSDSIAKMPDEEFRKIQSDFKTKVHKT